jgi:hypothetical protein
LRLRAAAHADEYVPMEDVIEFVLKLSEAGRAALAKLAERDALCEQQTRTIALTSERAVKAEKERDEVGIQLAAAQAEIGRLKHRRARSATQRRKERFEEIAEADKLVVDLNEVTNALSAAHTREAIARAENARLREAIARAENARLRDTLHDIREWAKPEHVLRFDDGDVALADYITNALEKRKP